MKPFRPSALLSLGFVALVGPVAGAATLSPISVTGYNKDVIFENAPTSTVNGYFGSRTFIEEGVTSPTPPGGFVGLRADRTYTVTVGSNAVTFQLGAYNANNVADVSQAAGNSALLTLLTPGNFSELAVAYSLGNGVNTTNLQAVVHYSDSSTDSFSLDRLDWGNSPTANAVEVFNVNRANDVNGNKTLDAADAIENGATWSIYGSVLTINPAKIVKSVSLDSLASIGSGDLGFFALSGASVPEPASAALLAALPLLIPRRRR